MKKGILIPIMSTMLLISACSVGEKPTVLTDYISEESETDRSADIEMSESVSISGPVKWEEYATFIDYLEGQSIISCGKIEYIPVKKEIEDYPQFQACDVGSGILSVMIVDLDHDDKDEMLIVKINRVDEENLITGSVFEQSDDYITESNDVVLALDAFRFEEENNIIFLKQVDGNYLICGESQKDSMYADGGYRKIDVYSYQDSEMQPVFNMLVSGFYTEDDKKIINNKLLDSGLIGKFWSTDMIADQNTDAKIICSLLINYDNYANIDELHSDYDLFTQKDDVQMKPMNIIINDESDLVSLLKLGTYESTYAP